jgi:hypothetical protein
VVEAAVELVVEAEVDYPVIEGIERIGRPLSEHEV